MSMPPPAIDWPHVLGPIVHSFTSSELELLSKATTEYHLRAIRLHPRRCVDDLPFETEPVPWFQHGRFLPSNAVRPGEFLHFAAGDYYIQDAGSMLALALCELAQGQWVCDTCASPGGKSTGALEQLDGTGILVANEVIGSRLAILNLALARAGFGNQLVTSMEVDQLSQQLGPCFDCVIVDAPCTGQSMVVRGKQSLAAYSPPQIEHSSARQRRIVRAAAELVKPGGRLVYSTCTFSFAENEQVVTEFVDQNRNWKLKRFNDLAQWETPGFHGCYRLWPHHDRCAGAFAAVAIRADKELVDGTCLPWQSQSRPQSTSGSRLWNALHSLPAELNWIEELRDETSLGRWYVRGNHIHRFDEHFPNEWIAISSSGLAVADTKDGRFEPLYGSAVSQYSPLAPKRIIDLGDQDAARYVAGEAIRYVSEENGWCAVAWRGRPLAWGKLAAGVLKNHFPKALRQAKHA